MAYFAEISEFNKVTRVLSIPNEQEHRGQEFLANDLGLGGTWIQTSFNTINGEHLLGGTPLRKNFAGIGFTYDESRDAFIPEPVYKNWVLDEETCNWVAPIPYPNDDKAYIWNDNKIEWEEVNQQETEVETQ
jgi:hypothetical protein